MPDRSSRHGLPDKWDHGSHARRQYSVTGASDGSGAAKTEAIPGTTDAYGPANTDPFASPPGGYGASTADPFANPPGGYGASTADPFANPPGGYGASTADPFASPPGGYGASTADPFGGASTVGAEPFRTRNADPFAAAATGAFGTASFGAETLSVGAGGAGVLGAGVLGAGALAAAAAEAETARPRAESPAAVGDRVPTQATDTKSFLSALFDFGFTSFVTPKVIKALYVLIAIGTVLSALVFTVFAFKASLAFGIVTLIFADPLFVLIVLAIYRIALEFFMVTFRMGEDIRALRERGDLR